MRIRTTVMVLALLVLTACSATDSSPTAPPPASSPPTQSPEFETPPSTPSPEPAEPPPSAGPGELERWFDADFTGGDLTLGEVRERTDAYTSYDAAYSSEDLHITGVINVPQGDGPFPAVVLGHGYIDPAIYESGQGMTRERTYLAQNGYLAFHVDYRNHAGSDDDPNLDQTMRFGYAVDMINAVNALRDSDLPIDGERVAFFGRSMGGGVVLEALEMAPGLVDAAVMYSSISSEAADNQAQFDGVGFWSEVAATEGSPVENPEFYQAASTRPHLDRVTEPVLIIHGRNDTTCPPEWAQETFDAFEAAGVEAELAWFDDGHEFGTAFDASMTQIDEFLTTQW